MQYRSVCAGALILVLAGCATLPKDIIREPSQAWDRPQETKLGRALAEDVAEHPGISGFLIIGNGLDAFVARMALADAAERTLDLQYYIFHDDLTGKLILDNVLIAADRGVRVRILVDDTTAKGRDAGIAALAAHPRIQVRVFNPSAGRSSVSWLFNAASDFDRINHRMHNKMFVADNQAGVVGGRNIGDEYFSAREGVNFADLDLLAVGPVVQDLSRTFDEYWNSTWAYPIESLHSSKPGLAALEQGREILSSHRTAARDSEYAKRLRESDLLKKLLARELPLVWAPAQVVSDRPDKAGSGGDPETSVLLGPQLRPTITDARSEILISSPYFIPGESGVASFRQLREQGVRIRILTNSLAANDVSVVHSGYAKYRKDLLKIGVELYEIKPSLETSEHQRRHFGSSGASLHAKSFIFDRRKIFVGSLNLDPRSVYLNTELGIVVDSPELAGRMAAGFEEIIARQFSYRVVLEDDDLVWVTGEGEREVRFTREPEAGIWRRFSAWFLSLFAPESLL